MAFDFGAALSSAGEITPAYQQAQENILQKKREQQEFALNQRAKTASTVAAERQNKLWIPVRTYKDAEGTKTIYLTPEGGYTKPILEEADPITQRKQYLDSLKKMNIEMGLSPAQQDEFILTGSIRTDPRQRIKWGMPVRVDPSISPSGWATEASDLDTGAHLYWKAAEPSRANVGSTTDTRRWDHMFGEWIDTQSVRTPNTGAPVAGVVDVSPTTLPPQLTGQPAPSSPTTPKPHGGSTVPHQLLTPPKTGTTATGLSLDENGHIPPNPRIPEPVRSAANDLFDGVDLSKIPARMRGAAEAVARQYGFQGQGLFTPKEKLQLNLVKPFVVNAMRDPSLKVLDDAGSRLKLTQSMEEKPGMIGRFIQPLVPLNNDETAYLRMYNQLASQINGLAGLTRGGTRGTEAAVQRLLTELPNPRQSHSSDDARERLQRILNEITIAEKTGHFQATSETSQQGADPAVDRFLLTLPSGGQNAKPR